MGTVKAINVCHLASGDLWAGAEVQLATLLDGLRAHDDLRLRVILFNSGVLADRVRELGLQVQVVEERDHRSMRLVAMVCQSLREHPCDILHTHRYKENFIGALAGWRAGVRHQVRTVHGLRELWAGLGSFKSRLYTGIDSLVTRWRVAKTIAVSQDIERQLSTKFGSERVAMIHNGIDRHRLQPPKSRAEIRTSLKLEPHHRLIGSVGRLTPIKAYHHLLGAFKVVCEKEPNARLVLVGDGPERSNLERLAKSYGLDDRVIFFGFTPAVGDILGALDLFVLSSLHEGISISLLESLALGVPVVATAVGGNPEIIDHGVNGLLVPPQNEPALAEAILAILGDPSRSDIFRMAGKQTIAREFSKEIMAARVHNLYRQIVDVPRERT